MSAGEKTEEPTDKKLRDLREEGRVCTSQEVPATAVVLTLFGFIWFGFSWISGRLTDLFLLATKAAGKPFPDAFAEVSAAAGETLATLSLVAVALTGVAGLTGHLAQNGLLFAWKAARPSLDKLNPKQWFSRVFSLRNLVDFLRNILKTVVIVVAFYLAVKNALPLILRLPGHGLNGVNALLREVMRNVAIYSGASFAAIAVGDWLFQRWQYLRENRMSKEEVKTEYKQMEGDPQIKGQRRQLAQEMAMNDAVQGARRADVLITNPTHLAIAIEYKKEKNQLPVILAKGEDFLAARMIKAAEEAGVPIMRNVPLAHDLWETGKEMEYIPSDLIEPVAEVLRWLEELRRGEERQ